MDKTSSLLIIITGLVFFIGLMIAIRQLYLWYFRINEMVDLMKSQDKSLQQIVHYLSNDEIRKQKSSGDLTTGIKL